VAEVLDGRRRYAVICADNADVLPLLPDRSVDHVITDPPYDFGHYSTDDGCASNALRELSRIPSLAVFGYAQNLVEWCAAMGRVPDEWIVWFPTNHAPKAGGRWAGLPRWAEHVAVFGPVKAKRLVRDRNRAGINTKRGEGEARVGDVWTDAAPGIGFNSPRRLHPNEKPEDLMVRLVALTSEPGDLILDPFCGSGTTGVAALRLGRRFIGIEREPKWAELSRERLRAEESGSTLQAQRAGQVPLFGGPQ
jgi:DNA modification methylase